MGRSLRTYIASVLLLVFSFANLPASVFHQLFANHTDLEDNYCTYYHKDIGTHIEPQQTHCDLFKADTPLYDAIKIQVDLPVYCSIISIYQHTPLSAYCNAHSLLNSSRAPPAC